MTGCLGNAPTGTTGNGNPGGSSNQTAAPALAFGDPVQMPNSSQSSEPSIRAAPDGSLWIAAPSGFVTPIVNANPQQEAQESYLWRSGDGGATWTSVHHAPLPMVPSKPGGGDSAIATPTSKTIYYADLYAGSVNVQASHDGGRTWNTTNPVGSPVPSDRQWIVGRGDTDAWLVFQGFFEPGIYVTRTTDGGTTWTSPSLITADHQIDGNIVLTPDGSLAEVYSNSTGVVLATSTDNGTTWDLHQVNAEGNDTGNLFPSVAVDPAGNLYVAFSEPSGNDTGYRVYLQASTDGGRNWTSPLAVSAANVTAIMPWVAAGSPGHVALAWYETDGANVHPGSAPNSTRWFVGAAVVANATHPSGSDVAAARAISEPNHLGQICMSGVGCSGSGDRRLADFLQVTWTPAGHVVVTYTDTHHQPDGVPRVRAVSTTQP